MLKTMYVMLQPMYRQRYNFPIFILNLDKIIWGKNFQHLYKKISRLIFIWYAINSAGTYELAHDILLLIQQAIYSLARKLIKDYAQKLTSSPNGQWCMHFKINDSWKIVNPCHAKYVYVLRSTSIFLSCLPAAFQL